MTESSRDDSDLEDTRDRARVPQSRGLAKVVLILALPTLLAVTAEHGLSAITMLQEIRAARAFGSVYFFDKLEYAEAPCSFKPGLLYFRNDSPHTLHDVMFFDELARVEVLFPPSLNAKLDDGTVRFSRLRPGEEVLAKFETKWCVTVSRDHVSVIADRHLRVRRASLDDVLDRLDASGKGGRGANLPRLSWWHRTLQHVDGERPDEHRNLVWLSASSPGHRNKSALTASRGEVTVRPLTVAYRDRRSQRPGL